MGIPYGGVPQNDGVFEMESFAKLKASLYSIRSSKAIVLLLSKKKRSYSKVGESSFQDSSWGRRGEQGAAGSLRHKSKPISHKILVFTSVDSIKTQK